MAEGLNLFFSVKKHKKIGKLFPIPKEYCNKAKYAMILYDLSKVLYYDENHNYLCSVNQISNTDKI